MLFNRQAYNRGAYFNRYTPSIIVSFSGTASFVFTGVASTLHAAARYGLATVGVVFGCQGNMAVVKPYGETETGIVFDDQVKISADAYCEGSTGIVFDAIATAIRIANDKELALANLNFKPGDTITIDTETLDVFINGEPDVDCWVTGSDFFKLGRGVNTLTFYDDVSERELEVTVIWADRWL